MNLRKEIFNLVAREVAAVVTAKKEELATAAQDAAADAKQVAAAASAIATQIVTHATQSAVEKALVTTRDATNAARRLGYRIEKNLKNMV